MTNETSDGEIARQIATESGGAEAAKRALCERFAPRIRLYGLRHLRDDGLAGDLVQSVLVRVLEALREGRVETPDHLGSFVLGTCRFIAWDMRRAERRQVAIQNATLTLHAETQPPSTSEADKLRLFRCLQGLPARDSQVVRMSFLEDRPADEIAELSPSHPKGAACSIFAQARRLASGSCVPIWAAPTGSTSSCCRSMVPHCLPSRTFLSTGSAVRSRWRVRPICGTSGSRATFWCG